MGEIADLILAGILCEQCGEFLGEEEVGYPRLCEDCEKENIKGAMSSGIEKRIPKHEKRRRANKKTR